MYKNLGHDLVKSVVHVLQNVILFLGDGYFTLKDLV